MFLSSLKIFIDSIKKILKSPIIILPFLCLFILQILLQPLSITINSGFINSGLFVHYLILGAYIIFSIIYLSFFLSGSIFMAMSKKTRLLDFFKGSRFTFKNFVLIALNIMIYLIIFNYITMPLALLIGRTLSLKIIFAQAVFILIYIILLMSVLLFFSMSSFVLVLENTTIITSIKKSIKFVKSNYFDTVILIVIFFILDRLTGLLSGIQIASIFTLKELLDFAIIYSLLAVVFTLFYEKKKTLI